MVGRKSLKLVVVVRIYATEHAHVAELEYALVLGTSGEVRESSSLSVGTRIWRNWQTHHLEGVARQLVSVQLRLSAPAKGKEVGLEAAIL